MKKKLAMLICAAMLVLGIAAPPALAAEQHYPISVEAYMEGDTPCVRKVYQLALSDDPSSIPTGDFERDGRLYRLLDMTRRDEVGVDTQSYSQTVRLDSDTGEMSEVLKKLDAQIEAETEDGYTGTLTLDHTSIKVEVKGYKTKTRSLSATRTYPSLSDADLSLVPKTIEDSGRTLTLADVQWSNDGTCYTAAASYTGTASSRYATGYAVTANYTGQVSKTGCEVVTYTAIFQGTEIPAAEVPDSQTDQAPDSSPDGMGWFPVLGCVTCGAVIALAAVLLVRNVKRGRCA